MLLLSKLVALVAQISEHRNGGHSVLKSDVAASLTLLLSLILTVFVTVTERRNGAITSGTLFVFWCLLTASKTVTFYSSWLNEVHWQRPGIFALLVIEYGIICIILLLHCLADKPTDSQSKRICKELEGSFLSGLTFWWMNRLMIRGYNAPLTEDSVDDLHPEQMAGSIMSFFLRHWDVVHRELGKTSSVRSGRQSAPVKTPRQAPITRNQVTNSHLATDSLPSSGEDSTEEADKEKPKRENKEKRPRGARHVSLLRVLWRSFGSEALVIQLWQIGHDVFLLTKPIVVGLLIDFIEDDTAPTWRGYLFCLLLFLSTILQAVFDKQVYHRCGCLGLRVRIAVISAVYRKALKLDVAARQESTVGEMVNLMSVDSEHLQEFTTALYMLWSGPVQLLICLVLLYSILGPSILVGLILMVVMVPANMFILKQQRRCKMEVMKLKDSRLKILYEVLNGIKILKMYAWEPSFHRKINQVRERELEAVWGNALWDSFLYFSWLVAPYILACAIFITYIYTDDEHYLSPRTAFVTLTYLNVIRFNVSAAPRRIINMIRASVSIGRLDHYLNLSEVDPDNVCRESYDSEANDQGHVLSIHHASFSWNLDLGLALKDINVHVTRGSLVAVVGPVGAGKSSLLSAWLGEMHKLSGGVLVKGSVAYVPQQAWIQHDTLRGNILFSRPLQQPLYSRCLEACALLPDLDILPGADMTEIGEKGINLSGGQKQRVSLARAVYSDADVYLLDDPLSAVDVHVGMHIFRHVVGHDGLLAGKTRVLVTHGVQWLPNVDVNIMMREGCVVEMGPYNDLIKRNGPFVQYLRNSLSESEKPSKQSDLEGQKIEHPVLWQGSAYDGSNNNINSNSNNIANDKPNHLTITTTAATIANGIAMGTLSSPSSAIPRNFLDTTTASDMALRKRLNVTSRGSIREQSGKEVVQEEPEKKRTAELAEITTMRKQGNDATRKQGNKARKMQRLVEEEAVQVEKVKWSVYREYLRTVGWVYSAVIVGIFILYQAANVISDIFLSQWTDDTRLNNLTLNPANSAERMALNEHYLLLYGGFGALQALTVVSFMVLQSYRIIVPARYMHERMLSSVLHAPVTFFDVTPLGRIVSRFSGDINTVDKKIHFSFVGTVESTIQVLSSLLVVTYGTPWFLVALLPLFVMYILVQRFYIPTSRQLRRLESKSRSPVYSFFSESLAGASVVRAYGAQSRFVTQLEGRLNENSRFRFYTYCANRWLGFRLEVLGALVVLVTSLAAVSLRHEISPGLAGLAITYALSITSHLQTFIYSIGELESDVVSMERIAEMTNIEQEAPWKLTTHQPPRSWPEKGKVKVDDVNLSYRRGLDLVLRGVSFSVQEGEKVGIVGRTGAGKSTLTLAFFRLLELATGRIHIDDLDIATIGLHDLRSRLAVLPQDPVIFAGSVRSNLDPLNEFTDREIWSALKHAHLKSFVANASVGLNYECGEGGENLSFGQRQLLCLARTLLRRAKILVLDEATAAVDMETDDLIQQTLRTQFADCTVLTIAHRLHTVVDYDKILVLDNGEVKAYDTPQRLLQSPGNAFYHMAVSAGLLNHHQQRHNSERV